MYGGFAYWLEPRDEGIALIAESWIRVVEGSGQRHEITADGSRLVGEGFVSVVSPAHCSSRPSSKMRRASSMNSASRPGFHGFITYQCGQSGIVFAKRQVTSATNVSTEGMGKSNTAGAGGCGRARVGAHRCGQREGKGRD